MSTFFLVAKATTPRGPHPVGLPSHFRRVGLRLEFHVATRTTSDDGSLEDLVQALGIERMSKSQVSELAKTLDETVRSFRERPLEGAYRYVWLDALVFKCREGGRVVNVAGLVAVGVDAEGRREVLGLDVVTSEDGAGWLAFLRSLVARGLRGVELVISDAHVGLEGGDRLCARRRVVAVPHALHAQPAPARAQVDARCRRLAGAQHLRAARC